MSGLESIALAVAHLEEMSKRSGSVCESRAPKQSACDQKHAQEATARGVSPSPTMAMNSIPPPPSLAQGNSRVVSTDSLSHTAPSSASEVDSTSADAASSARDAKYLTLLSSKDKDKEIPSSSSSTPTVESTEQASSEDIMNKGLESVLADPTAWLHQFESKSIPEPPKGEFQGSKVSDVLCGRGGESNHHPGNQAYRKLVKAFQPLYISSKRRSKPMISECIVYTIRSYGGRFLRRTNPRESLYEDVGNTKAREKTSQALREGAPDLRTTLDPKEVLAKLNKKEKDNYSRSTGAPAAQPPPSSRLLSTTGPSPFPNHPSYMDVRILQAQMDAYALTYARAGMPMLPFNPATNMGAIPGHGDLVMLSRKNQPPFYGAPLAPVASNLESKKRSLSDAMSSTCSQPTSTSQNTATSTQPFAASDKPRGPRLKRFKQRLHVDNSEDDHSESAASHQASS